MDGGKKPVWQVGRYGSSPSSADNALRDKLHKEIERKSKVCNNPTYNCTSPRLDGYEYCAIHILRDPRGHYRQCTFLYGNGKKCTNAVSYKEFDKRVSKGVNTTSFCFEHSREAQLRKTRATVGQLLDVESNETLLHDISHHINVTENIPKPEVDQNQEEEIDVVSPDDETFVSHTQINSLEEVLDREDKKPRILDYASDSSEEYVEPVNHFNTYDGQDCDDVEHEFYGSDDEDPRKRANIYTYEEGIRICIDKMTKLRGHYIGQTMRCQHLLKNCRRRYIAELRKEREVHCSIHKQPKDTYEERRDYNDLKMLERFHRRNGTDAVLYKKLKEKRARLADPYLQKPAIYPKCVFTEGGVKCGVRVIPCSKYCKKHILEDKKQVLFRACEVEKSNVVCKEPIPCIGEHNHCLLHLNIPLKQEYTQKKNEAETDDEFLKDILNPIPEINKVVKRRGNRRTGRPARRRRNEFYGKLRSSLVKSSKHKLNKIRQPKENPIDQQMPIMQQEPPVQEQGEIQQEYQLKIQQLHQQQIQQLQQPKFQIQQRKSQIPHTAPQILLLKTPPIEISDEDEEKKQETIIKSEMEIVEKTPQHVENNNGGEEKLDASISVPIEICEPPEISEVQSNHMEIPQTKQAVTLPITALPSTSSECKLPQQIQSISSKNLTILSYKKQHGQFEPMFKLKSSLLPYINNKMRSRLSSFNGTKVIATNSTNVENNNMRLIKNTFTFNTKPNLTTLQAKSYRQINKDDVPNNRADSAGKFIGKRRWSVISTSQSMQQQQNNINSNRKLN